MYYKDKFMFKRIKFNFCYFSNVKNSIYKIINNALLRLYIF